MQTSLRKKLFGKFSAVLICFVSLASLSRAVDTTFTATLTNESPTWDRYTSGPGAFPYLTISMIPSVTGLYDVINTSTSGISDPYIYMYTGSFDVNNPSATFLASDDDSGPGYLFALNNLSLTAGTTYVLVPTVYDSEERGSFSFTVSGAGSVSASIEGGEGGTEGPPPATDIADSETTYLASNLGSTVNPVFTGGTLTLDADATHNDDFTAGPAVIDTAGHAAELSGVISNDDSETPGSLTVINTSEGGSLTLSGNNTYTGATNVANGATLFLSGSLASSTVSIASGATLNDQNAGLASNTVLTNNGLLSLGADETISSLTNTGAINGSHTLTASTYALNNGSTINANLGTGSLTSNGSVALNGTSAASTVTVQSGTLALGSANRLSSDAAVTNSATLVLGGNETISSLNNTGTLNGSHTLIASTYALNNGSTINANLGTGSLTSNGSVALNGTSAASTVTVQSGTLTLGSANRLASDAAVAIHSSTHLTLGGNQTVSSLISYGQVSGSGKTLTAATYDLRTGAVIDANLGEGTLFSNGSVLLNGTSAAETIKVQTGALTLGGANLLADTAWVDVSEDASLILSNGNDTIRLLTGGGDITLLNGSVLTVREGSYSGGATSTGALLKDSNPILSLSGHNTYESGTIVRNGELDLTTTGQLTSDVTIEQDGTLRVNGLVQGAVHVDEGGHLRGSGVIASNVINYGTTSPGNSPGVLTVSGDYTENGVLNIEIDGIAGAGNASGHDQLEISGTFFVNDGSTLLLTHSVANGFEPAVGERFLVVNAAGGIEGGFSFLDRSDYATKLLFDYGSGYVFGTSVAEGDPLLTLGGNNANRRALAGLLSANAVTQDDAHRDAFFDSRTPAGALFRALLEAPSVHDALEALSPSPYAGLTEYALRTTRNVSRDAAHSPALLVADGWQVSAGYHGYKATSDTDSRETDFNLRSNGASVGLSRQLGSRVVLGGFYAHDEGSITGSRLDYDASGDAVGIHGALLKKDSARFSADAGASYGRYEFEGRRVSMLSVVDAETDSEVYDLWAGADYELVHGRRANLSAVTDFAYTAAYVDGFSENGSIDAFRVHGQKDKLLIGEAGLEATTSLTRRLTLVARGTYAHNFQDRRREIYASLRSGGGRARVTAPGLDEDAVNVGLNLRYTSSDRVAASAYYETDLKDDMGNARTYGARVSFSF